MASLQIPLWIVGNDKIILEPSCQCEGYIGCNNGMVIKQQSGHVLSVYHAHRHPIIALHKLSAIASKALFEYGKVGLLSVDCNGGMGIWGEADGRCLRFNPAGDASCIEWSVLLPEDGLVCIAGRTGRNIKFYSIVTLEPLSVLPVEFDIGSLSSGSVQGDKGNQTIVVVRDNHGEIEKCWGMGEKGVRLVEVGAELVSHHSNAQSADFSNLSIIGTEIAQFTPSAFLQTSGHSRSIVMGSQEGNLRVCDGSVGILQSTDRPFSGPFPGIPITAMDSADGVNGWAGDACGGVFGWAVGGDGPSDLFRIGLSDLHAIFTIHPSGIVLAVSADGLACIRDGRVRYYIQAGRRLEKILVDSEHHQHLFLSVDDGYLRIDLESGIVIGSLPSIDKIQCTVLPAAKIDHLEVGPLRSINIYDIPGTKLFLDIRQLLTVKDDQLLREHLLSLLEAHCSSKQSDAIHFGIIGANDSISLLSSTNGLLAISPAMTAMMLLTYLSLSYNNGQLGSRERQNVLHWLHHPTTIRPASGILAKYWADHVMPFELSARFLISQLFEMGGTITHEVVEFWTEHLAVPPVGIKRDTPMNRATIVLSLILLSDHNTIEFSLTLHQSIAASLVAMVREERKHLFRIAAIDLMGLGFHLWEPFIDAAGLLRLLLRWLTPSGTEHKRDPWNERLFVAIKGAITGMLLSNPERILTVWITELTFEPLQIDAAVSIALFHSIITHSTSLSSLSNHAHYIAEVTVRLLAPSFKMRNRLLPTATPLLFALVQRFPSLAFHTASQRLAVGRPDGSLAVFDVRHGTRVFSNVALHSSAVTCSGFDATGAVLATFSGGDQRVARVRLPPAGDENSLVGSGLSALLPWGTGMDKEPRYAQVPKEALAAYHSGLNEYRIDIASQAGNTYIVRLCINGQEFMISI